MFVHIVGGHGCGDNGGGPGFFSNTSLQIVCFSFHLIFFSPF